MCATRCSNQTRRCRTCRRPGVSGIDLYARDDKGRWRWVNVTKPADKQVNQSGALSEGMTAAPREYAFYLPLYNGVDKVEIGVNEGATFEGLAPRKKPIVFYGTSITHGACASRPGMCHPAILGRRLDMPVANLGFSGNGKMDASVGELLGQGGRRGVRHRLPAEHEREARDGTLRSARETTPRRAAGHAHRARGRSSQHQLMDSPRAREASRREPRGAEGSLCETAGRRREEIHYIGGDHLLGDDADGATDGSHPNDLGFVRQADVMEPVIRKAIGI